MKSYLIDPVVKTVTEVEVETHRGDVKLDSIYAHLKCNCFDLVRFSNTHYVFVDDEGLLGDLEQQAFFIIKGYAQPLAGRGLVFFDGGEHSRAPKLSIEEVRTMIAWPTLRDCVALTGGKWPPQVRILFSSGG